MHDAVVNWVTANLPDRRTTVLECGSRNMNGSVRGVFAESTYTGVDIEPGHGVDVVADFATYTHPTPVDVVLALEVFEHVEHWQALVTAAHRNLALGGVFVATMATTGRGPHSGRAATGIQPDEFYRNITKAELIECLTQVFGPESFTVDRLGTDLRCVAEKRRDPS